MSAPPESLSMFVLKMRKRFGATTVDTFTLNRLYLMTVTEMRDFLGREKANLRIFEWGYAMGHAYLLKLGGRDIARYPPSQKVIRVIGRAAWYMFSGRDPEAESEERRAVGGNYIIVRFRDRRSPWASEIETGDKICYYPTGAYEGASNTYMSLAPGETRYYTVVRETACLAAGDEYCELTLVAVPKQTPRERVVEDFPELFADVSMDASRELHEKYFGD